MAASKTGGSVGSGVVSLRIEVPKGLAQFIRDLGNFGGSKMSLKSWVESGAVLRKRYGLEEGSGRGLLSVPGRIVFLRAQYRHDPELGRLVPVRPRCQTCGDFIQEAYAYSTVTGHKYGHRHLGCAERVGLLRPSWLQKLKTKIVGYLKELARRVGFL